MPKFFILLSVLLLAAAGCADMKKLDKSAREVEQQGDKWKDQSRSRTVEVTDEPYLGAKSVPLNSLVSPVLSRQVTFKRRGSLSTVATAIGELVGIPVQIYQDEDSKKSAPSPQEARQQAQPPAPSPAPADIDANWRRFSKEAARAPELSSSCPGSDNSPCPMKAHCGASSIMWPSCPDTAGTMTRTRTL